jgi:hypothetical protein
VESCFHSLNQMQQWPPLEPNAACVLTPILPQRIEFRAGWAIMQRVGWG